MEDIIVNTVRFESCNEFVVGKYRNDKDILKRKDITEEQIMSALGKSKTFKVRDCFGGIYSHKFTIIDIEKTEYDDYIYTIESSGDYVPNRYFPSPYKIVGLCPNVAIPISYSIIHA